MGIRDRFKLVATLLIAGMAMQECSAQVPPAYPAGGPSAFNAGQNYSATAYQGMPQSFQAHPQISPYQHAMEQHYRSDGLWFKRFVSAMGPANEYSFGVDFIRTKTRGQDGLIGHPNAPSYTQDVVRDGGLPDGLFFESFPVWRADAVDLGQSNGIRLHGSVENRQGWGFKWNATHFGEYETIMDLAYERSLTQLHFFDSVVLEESGGIANGELPANLRVYNEREYLLNDILGVRIFDAADAESFGISGTTFDILDRNLYPFASVPIQTGDPNFPQGVPMLFDAYFTVATSVETWQTGSHFSLAPVLEKDSLKVRPVVGGRVFRVNERFAFYGGDSGLGYTFSEPNGLDDDDDFVIDNVDENGTLNFVAVIPDGSQEILFRAYTQSQVRSTLYGPEIGIEYDMGDSKGIEFSGHTKVGVMFNNERRHLEGDNIGNPFLVEIDPDTLLFVRTDMFDTTTVGGQKTQNFFSQDAESSHLSPMFEQQLNAEFPIFAHIPVLRDCWQLEQAKLKLGWNFILIGKVADPSETIVWQANPKAGIFPYLNTNRGNFYQHTLSAGVDWAF